ncbi:hypothetical protein M407DRAFT_240698 [Tulasnella calospora MUT 4182]|uniref:Uncharacterized protein n=1 Tax=Tulasnella calospora MUT 4182 TaxID=1051891 RepID=A0A0C3QMX1_9AGAM|nr:hypothetical protein M407DRAFT_240698 [Tulasnella calospora MUT 4182]
MDSGNGGEKSPELDWLNVGLGFGFIIFNVILSGILGLEKDISASLVIAALRCIGQLSLLTVVLKPVFSGGPWAVAGIVFLFNVLGTFEAVYNKSKRRFTPKIPSVFLSMAGSTIPVSILGSRFAMNHEPFWKPDQYIPVLGMLCGSTISGMVVAVSFVLKEIQENRDKVETYLAFGASRFEACKPIATEALRLALLPTINQMSVIGLIAIPGMMTGALLGGSSVEQAAKLQMIIMFMINSCTTLASLVAVTLTLLIVVDPENRLRLDKVDSEKALIWKARDRVIEGVVGGVKSAFGKVFRRRNGGEQNKNNGVGVRDGERQPLLG